MVLTSAGPNTKGWVNKNKISGIPKIAVLGNSLSAQTSYSTDSTFALRAKGALGWGLAYAGINAIYDQSLNFGVGGEKSTDILARIDDVVAAHPDIVVISAGGNDLLNGIHPDVITRNIQLIVARFQKEGVFSIVCTIPTATGIAIEQDWYTANQQIISFCEDSGIECCRVDTAYLDPSIAFPSFQPGSVLDGTHYTGRGAELVGKILAVNLQNLVVQQSDLPVLANDAGNVSDDPMGLAQQFVSAPHGGSTVTDSYVAHPDVTKGEWFELDITSASSGDNQAGLVVTGLNFSSGTATSSMEIKVEDVVNLEYLYLEQQAKSASESTYSRCLYHSDETGYFQLDGNKDLVLKCMEFPIPKDTIEIRLVVHYQCVSGKISLGRNIIRVDEGV